MNEPLNSTPNSTLRLSSSFRCWVKLNIEGKTATGTIYKPSTLEIRLFAEQAGRQCQNQRPLRDAKEYIYERIEKIKLDILMSIGNVPSFYDILPIDVAYVAYSLTVVKFLIKSIPTR